MGITHGRGVGRLTRRSFVGHMVAGAAALGLARSGRSQEPGPVGVVVASDIHLLPDQPLSPRSFMTFVEDVNERLPDTRYVLLLGDLMDWGTDESFELMAELQGHLRPRVLGALGNHDFSPKLEGDETGERSDVRSLERFVDYLSYAPGPYYSFAAGNVRFIVLATERYHSNPSDVAYGGWISDTQIEWLDGQLSTAEQASENVILCSHHGIMGRAWHTDVKPYSLNPADPLDEVLGSRPVDVSFSGHVHGQVQAQPEMIERAAGTTWVNGGALSHFRDGRMQCRYFELVDGARSITLRSRDVADVRETPEADHPTGCFLEDLDTQVELSHTINLSEEGP